MIRLKIVSGSRSGTTLAFGRDPVRVGRSPSADLRFHDTQDSMVSGHHAQIVFERGAYQLLDLGSRNGTFLNGRRLTVKAALCSDDRIGFGQPGGPEADVEIDDIDGAVVRAGVDCRGGVALVVGVLQHDHLGAHARQTAMVLSREGADRPQRRQEAGSPRRPSHRCPR